MCDSLEKMFARWFFGFLEKDLYIHIHMSILAKTFTLGFLTQQKNRMKKMLFCVLLLVVLQVFRKSYPFRLAVRYSRRFFMNVAYEVGYRNCESCIVRLNRTKIKIIRVSLISGLKMASVDAAVGSVLINDMVRGFILSFEGSFVCHFGCSSK